MKAIALLCRLALASVFLMASLAKIGQTSSFRTDIDRYQLLPRSAASAIAYGLPWLELALSVGLFLGVVPRLTGGMALSVLALFIAAAISAVWRDLPVSCSCFGLLYRKPITRTTIARDSLLLALSLVVLVWGPSVPTFFVALTHFASVSQVTTVILTVAFAILSLRGAYLAGGLSFREAPALAR